MQYTSGGSHWLIGPVGTVVLMADGLIVSLLLLLQSQPYGDVSFSGSELMLIGVLLSAVCSALGIMFRLVVRLSEARAIRAEKLVDDLVPSITTTAQTVTHMAEAQAEQTELIKTLITGFPPDPAKIRRR